MDKDADGSPAEATPPQPPLKRRYATFLEFYPYYASQHQQLGTRLLHLGGTGLFLANTLFCLWARRPKQLLLGPLCAYSCAWVGHFFVERNRPATFTYPFWSLLGDFKMFLAILTGREPLKPVSP